jgi:hypothetical protein
VTEPGNVLLDRAQLERAFTDLGERLMRRGVVADVFIVGGAAMALAYDATRVTRDVDSLFVPHGVVLEEARNVAQDLGLPMWWLNDACWPRSSEWTQPRQHFRYVRSSSQTSPSLQGPLPSSKNCSADLKGYLDSTARSSSPHSGRPA